MKGLIILALSLNLLGACATAPPRCPAITDLRGSLGDLPRPEQLQERLSQIILAHCACDFPDTVRLFMPAAVNVTGSWDGVESECLGVLRVAEWTRESETLVAIHLKAADSMATGEDLYFMFASFDADEWMFSWPVAAGPGLHP